TCHVLYYYLIINYGVPTSLGYSVWFFAHAIHSLCQPQVRWFVTTPIILLVLVHFVFDLGSCDFPPR
ncbi:hypothetical protein EDD17DRAFT_1630420, partial [Pisolithus thermaeus]